MTWARGRDPSYRPTMSDFWALSNGFADRPTMIQYVAPVRYKQIYAR